MTHPITQIRGMFSAVPTPAQIAEHVKNKAEASVTAVKRWFADSDVTITIPLNKRFLEPIAQRRFPISRREGVISAVVMVAGATLSAYAIGFLTAGALMSTTFGVLGIGVGFGAVWNRVQRIYSAVILFRSTKRSQEEILFKEYSQYSKAQIRTKFKEWTECDMDEIYAPSQVPDLLKYTKNSCLEYAVLPALVRFALAKEALHIEEKQDKVEKRSVNMQGKTRIVYQTSAHAEEDIMLRSDEANTLFQYEQKGWHRLSVAKMEAAFALAILYHPHTLKVSSLQEMGTIYEYTDTSPLGVSLRMSNLPFLVGKKLDSGERYLTIRYQEVHENTLSDLVGILLMPPERYPTESSESLQQEWILEESEANELSEDGSSTAATPVSSLYTSVASSVNGDESVPAPEGTKDKFS